jgi:hypothetical protein
VIFTLSSTPGLHRPWLATARSRRVTLLHHSLSIVNVKIMPNRLENVKESVDEPGNPYDYLSTTNRYRPLSRQAQARFSPSASLLPAISCN